MSGKKYGAGVRCQFSYEPLFTIKSLYKEGKYNASALKNWTMLNWFVKYKKILDKITTKISKYGVMFKILVVSKAFIIYSSP